MSIAALFLAQVSNLPASDSAGSSTGSCDILYDRVDAVVLTAPMAGLILGVVLVSVAHHVLLRRAARSWRGGVPNWMQVWPVPILVGLAVYVGTGLVTGLLGTFCDDPKYYRDLLFDDLRDELSIALWTMSFVGITLGPPILGLVRAASMNKRNLATKGLT